MSTASADEPGRVPHRAVAPLLSGPRAHRLFALLGWALPRSGTAPVRAVGQVRVLPRGVLGRLGHGPLRLETGPDASRIPASRRLLVATAGSASLVTSEGRRLRIAAGEVALVHDLPGTRLEAEEEFLRYEYVLPAEHLLHGIPAARYDEAGQPVPRHVVQPFIALAGALLVSPDDDSDPRTVMHLQEALTHTAAAILPHLSARNSQELTSREARLMAAAGRLVAAHAHERRFTVGQLAEGLGVSRAWLYRVFAKQGVSPSEYLRTRRAPR